jgi:hypothetical protein
MLVFVGVGIGQVPQLLQQQGVLQYPLYRLDQIRLQRGGMLLFGVARRQEFLQGLIAFVCEIQSVPLFPKGILSYSLGCRTFWALL